MLEHPLFAMPRTVMYTAAARAALGAWYALWPIWFLMTTCVDAVVPHCVRAFRRVRRWLWPVIRVLRWPYDGLTSEEKTARRARATVMALMVISATVWLGIYASLRVELADERAPAVTGHYEHWSSPEDDSSTGIIDIPKARHHHKAQDAPSLKRRPRVGVGSRVHSFVRTGTYAFATGRTFHYRFLPNCHHRRSMVQAWMEKALSRHASWRNRGWMMEGYRCVFGGSGADYSSSGTPDVTAGTPKLNDAAEANAEGGQESGCGESTASGTPAGAGRKKTRGGKQLRDPAVNHKKGKSHATKKQRADTRANTGALRQASALTMIAVAALGCLYAAPASAAPTGDCPLWTEQSRWWGSVVAIVCMVVLVWGGAYCSKNKESASVPTVFETPPPDDKGSASVPTVSETPPSDDKGSASVPTVSETPPPDDKGSARMPTVTDVPPPDDTGSASMSSVTDVPPPDDKRSASVPSVSDVPPPDDKGSARMPSVTDVPPPNDKGSASMPSVTDVPPPDDKGSARMPTVSDVPPPDASNDPLDGLSIRLLKQILAQLPADKDLTTAEVCNEYVKEVTKESKQSFTEDYRRKNQGTTDVGPPDVFVSHAWSNSFRDLVEGVAMQSKKLGFDESTRVYVCMLCNNQHEWDGSTQVDFAVLAKQFKSNLVSTGIVIAIFDPWDKPTYLTRSWCIYELLQAILLGDKCKYYVVIPPSQRGGFIKALCNEFDKIMEVISAVKVEDADASVQSDREGVLHEVRASEGGVAHCNQVVCEGVRKQVRVIAEEVLAEMDAEGREEEAMWSLCNGLGRLYNQQGMLEKADELYDRAVELAEKLFGLESTKMASSLNNKALLLQDMGKYEEALPLSQRCRAIKEKVYGPDHPSLATSLNNEAQLLRQMGKSEEALPLYTRSREIFEKVLGQDHPNVATLLNNEAGLLRQMGKFEEALPLYDRASAIDEKVLGPDHPNVAGDLNNKAQLLRQMGKSEEALPLYTRSREIFEKVLGQDHPNVATLLNNEALLLWTMDNDSAEATRLGVRAAEIAEKALGADHPRTKQYKKNWC